MPRLSIEGALGIAAAFLLFVLDKMGISNTPVNICLFFLAAFLCIDSIIRSDWARSNKRKKLLAGGGVSIFYLAFGYWIFLYPHNKPEIERKIDRILESQEQSALGQRYSSEALLSRYPIGYVIFRLDSENRIVFYKNRSQVADYVFDWDKVRYLSNTSTEFEIQPPDISKRGGGFRMHGNSIGGNKMVGWSVLLFSDRGAKISAACEILDTDEKGVVFLVGLMPTT
jgi:hypothetical protein